MAKVRTVHRCSECGAAAARWSGRCGTCGEWNTLVEERDEPRPLRAVGGAVGGSRARAVPILEVDAGEWAARPTGVSEVDHVLGGGLVPGSVTLVGGEPGVGKSTLLLQVLASVAAGGARALLVTGEESAQQVRLRAERLGALHARLLLLAETDLAAVVEAIDDTRPDVVVVDSIQTMVDPELESAPGSVAQVRECAHGLVQVAKARGTAVVLVGHVTKEGSLAGPRVLEHVVDTVLSFEGDRHHALRMLRAVKHRFGPTGELGVFEMAEAGLVAVPDASALFLADRTPGAAGAAVVPALEGHRPLLIELQALVSKVDYTPPRRSAQGVDPGRLALLLAVLRRSIGVCLGDHEVYASVVGGVRVGEPAVDLALALAVTSAALGRALPGDLVVCGEVGLGGEVRQVGQIERRLAEAARFGFRQAVVPASCTASVDGMRLHPVRTLGHAVRAAHLSDA